MRERRRLILEAELNGNPCTVLTADQHRENAHEWYRNPMAFSSANVKKHGWNEHYVEDPVLAGRSPRELLMNEEITMYFGMYGENDREGIEPFTWLKHPSYRPYLPWKDTPDS